jgi:tRNA(fMet)-specific endonuclease VapC
MLDTNACVFLLNRARPKLARKVLSTPPGEIALSAITAAELTYGAAKSRRPAEARSAVEELLAAFALIGFDAPAIDAYGALRADLERRGKPIGPLDMLIAAHAVSQATILVTNNVREFKRVSGLRVEDWST